MRLSCYTECLYVGAGEIGSAKKLALFDFQNAVQQYDPSSREHRKMAATRNGLPERSLCGLSSENLSRQHDPCLEFLI